MWILEAQCIQKKNKDVHPSNLLLPNKLKAPSVCKAKTATFTFPHTNYTYRVSLFYKYCFGCTKLRLVWKQEQANTLLFVLWILKKLNIMGLMKVQYNRFKLDCLWKGAIQQTETKQSKSILLSSFHLYVRVVGSVGRGFIRQRGESVLGEGSYYTLK